MLAGIGLSGFGLACWRGATPPDVAPAAVAPPPEVPVSEPVPPPSPALPPEPAPAPAPPAAHKLASGAWVSAAVPSGVPPARVYVPKRPHPEGRWALLLHGWNQAAADWDTRTTVEAQAERLGWVLVAPDMGKSVYASRVYADVAKSPPDEPGLPRTDALLAWAEGELGLSADPAKRAVIGVSTGGRGAALLGERGTFGHVIALSGTYDLASLKPGTGEYRIHAVVFGERQAFAERWRTEDARGSAARLGGGAEAPFVSWWLGHGGADPYVPVGQTRGYAARLQKAGVPDSQVKLFIEDRAQHDWATWDRWLSRALPELTAP